ncbi:phage head closure protein [Mesobacillus subterraneus]|uniref:phage head closure protein n=1 Tax=Mesobacillus subterraneus TaxID=285983 RepID=UPI001CFE53F4|nr:phage head closure protein [Mesobacillus subterraneus]WLR53554.1 phage head closure protein [Mesobacillus subterraneus]
MNDLAYFPSIEIVEDDLGQVDEIETYSRQVFCKKKSVPQNEFFQAGLNDIKASIVIIVHTLDYQEEESVKYDGKVYRIYRSYERKDGKTELYGEVRAGG